jgi:hypothetical protein
MDTPFSSGSWLRRSRLALGAILLAYALLLRGLVAPLPHLPGSLEAALADPHYLCLTEGTDEGIPHRGSVPCGECCLALTRADAPPPAAIPTPAPWPRLVWRPGSLTGTAPSGEPHEEAWTRAHGQRGPPESRTPTSFT